MSPLPCHIALALLTLTLMLTLTTTTYVQQHRFTYNEPMPVESTTQSLCDLALRFGEDSEGSMVSGSRSPAALVAPTTILSI
jgi:hypothetical protein